MLMCCHCRCAKHATCSKLVQVLPARLFGLQLSRNQELPRGTGMWHNSPCVPSQPTLSLHRQQPSAGSQQPAASSQQPAASISSISSNHQLPFWLGRAVGIAQHVTVEQQAGSCGG